MAKGSMYDLFILGAAGLVIAVGILVASVVMTSIQAGTADVLTSVEAQNALTQGANAVNSFNYIFVVIFFGIGISGLIYAYLVPTHPIMIVASIIMLVAGFMVFPIISNTYETISDTGDFATASVNFGLIDIVMANLPLIIALFGALMIIVLFMRYNSGQGTI